MSLAVDLDPCHRYDWPDTPCVGVYSGAHACHLGGGHAGACVCGQCERVGPAEADTDPSATLAAAVLYARAVACALPVDDVAEREAERARASQPQGRRRRLVVRPAR